MGAGLVNVRLSAAKVVNCVNFLVFLLSRVRLLILLREVTVPYDRVHPIVLRLTMLMMHGPFALVSPARMLPMCTATELGQLTLTLTNATGDRLMLLVMALLLHSVKHSRW